MRNACQYTAWALCVLLIGVAGQATAEAKSRVKRARQAAPDGAEAGNIEVSLYGSELPLADILHQLIRGPGLRLIVRPDVDLRRMVDKVAVSMPLRDALRVTLTPLGYSFEIWGQELIIFRRYVRIFSVNIPTVRQKWYSFVSNEGSRATPESSSSGAQQGLSQSQSHGAGRSGLGARLSLQSESTSEGLWEELEKTLKTLLSADGTFSISRSGGLVTVNDVPEALDAVERYIDAINEEMGRQAVIEVRIAEVSLDDTAMAGVDWNAMWDRLANLGLTTASVAAQSLVRQEAAPVSFTVSGVSGTAVLHALETQGNVEIVSQPNVLVGNNLPAIIQVGQVRTFVESITLTTVGGNAWRDQMSVKTGVLNDGLIMSLLPRLHKGKRLTLAVSLVLQEVVKMEQRTLSGGTFELPTLNRRSYSGVVTGDMEETIIIAGLLDSKQGETSSGVPFLSKIPILGVLFGAQESKEQRTELVVLLTPKPADTAAGPSKLTGSLGRPQD